ncbi:MAG: hypothetical protein HUK16_09405, partial [Bacteroidales bacterium]|nr:hypothetical protein [Bacteroidales bacterium]
MEDFCGIPQISAAKLRFFFERRIFLIKKLRTHCARSSTQFELGSNSFAPKSVAQSGHHDGFDGVHAVF